MKYYFSRTVDLPFDRARDRVAAELEKEGFGIIVEIDLQKAFREKLGVEFRRYLILETCNPHTAFRAVLLEDKIGVIFPCNLVIQQTDDGKTEVAAVDPIASMMAIENGDIRLTAFETQKKLQRVIEAVQTD